MCCVGYVIIKKTVSKKISFVKSAIPVKTERAFKGRWEITTQINVPVISSRNKSPRVICVVYSTKSRRYSTIIGKRIRCHRRTIAIYISQRGHRNLNVSHAVELKSTQARKIKHSIRTICRNGSAGNTAYRGAIGIGKINTYKRTGFSKANPCIRIITKINRIEADGSCC